MREQLSLLAVALLLMGSLHGVAFAADIQCPSLGLCEGTAGDDTIDGTDNHNLILAYGGSDRPVYGMKGPDEIHGAYGYDTLFGGNGDDEIIGGENGTFSWDRLVGGDGNDVIDDTYAGTHNVERDALCGGPKEDALNSQDQGNRGPDYETDHLNRGTGNDAIIKDAHDILVSEAICEGS